MGNVHGFWDLKTVPSDRPLTARSHFLILPKWGPSIQTWFLGGHFHLNNHNIVLRALFNVYRMFMVTEGVQVPVLNLCLAPFGVPLWVSPATYRSTMKESKSQGCHCEPSWLNFNCWSKAYKTADWFEETFSATQFLWLTAGCFQLL